MLPTPRATDGTKGGPNQRGSSGDLMLPSAVQELPIADCFCELGYECLDCGRRRIARREQVTLPTRTARDWKNVGDPARTANRMADRGQPLGEVVVNALVPTPTGRDWRDGGDTGADVEDKAYLGRVVWNRDAWGRYAEAIQRWEVLTRPAPAPTELNKLGNRRLAPAFSEWLMGLPAGWVTDAPGITRNEALRALGNGVVPQQAAAAIAHLLDVMEVAA